MPVKRNLRPALLVRVLTAIGTTPIREAWLTDKNQWLHGVAEGKRITVNPVIEVVDTVIHEILHVLEPSWSERYVENRTTWLLRRMSDEQIQQVYEEYQRIAKKRRRRDGRRSNVREVRGGSQGPAERDSSSEVVQPDGAERAKPAV